ncbi:alcohol dehydrogenase catalytic domain-containing protein [Ramlibacter sp. GTP1]|uniref:alcohol dehydrogenase n=2 Tax=Ramlibacter albus TaxID=2079448 RepID=A0A923MD58_9BURK|nr:alcohol dehydrogenase catalytic domain-containing protein [Ramlibacter albus]
MPAPGERLREYTDPLPQPQGTEVLVRVGSSGVCHSDVHIWEGFFDLGNGRKAELGKNTPMPHTLGHEIAGEVVAVGPEARVARVGDRRVVYPWIGCGQCAACKSGNEHICTGMPRDLGVRAAGGFSTHVLVPHERYLVDAGEIPQQLACTYACSGLTAFSALKKALPGPLVIVGAGGVGLAAVRMAKEFHGIAAYVADIDPAKREAALQAGAAQAFDPREKQSVKDILSATGGGAAAAIDFVGAPSSTGFAMQVVHRGGKVVIVGLFGGALELSLPLLPLRALTLQGSYVGSLADLQELVTLARTKGAPQIPITERPLDAAQQSLDDLREGRVVGRVVLHP